MTPDQKEWIDNANYEALLRRNRFAPLGDPIFQGDTGAYFLEVMSHKKALLSNENQVATSKRIGWQHE